MPSKDWKERKASCDFIVVGSGCGGAVRAAQLAHAPNRASFCILERGREWPVGSSATWKR